MPLFDRTCLVSFVAYPSMTALVDDERVLNSTEALWRRSAMTVSHSMGSEGVAPPASWRSTPSASPEPSAPIPRGRRDLDELDESRIQVLPAFPRERSMSPDLHVVHVVM